MQRQLAAMVQELNSMARTPDASALAASDSFFRGMVNMVSSSAQFLAQQPGEPAWQIVDYLANDYNANDQQLHLAALQAVKDFEKNPAYSLGQNSSFFLLPATSCALKAAGRTK